MARQLPYTCAPDEKTGDKGAGAAMTRNTHRELKLRATPCSIPMAAPVVGLVLAGAISAVAGAQPLAVSQSELTSEKWAHVSLTQTLAPTEPGAPAGPVLQEPEAPAPGPAPGVVSTRGVFPEYERERRARGLELAGGAASFVWENDIFGGTDQNYSNGVQFQFTSGPSTTLPLVARVMPQRFRQGYSSWRTGLGFGHAIFTPEDISAPDPDPTDRPYAGWAYGSLAFYGERWGIDRDPSVRGLDTAQLSVGVVGDGAGAAWVQSEFHQLIDGEDPRGWRFQIEDEPGVVLRLQRQTRRLLKDFGPVEIDGEFTRGVALGNVETSGSFGLGARLGRHLGGDFGPPRIRPALGGASFYGPSTGAGWYLFGGAEARAIAHTIFLDGNTFRDSRSVDRKPLVLDAQAGLAVRLGRMRATFTYVHRTEEFETQDGPSRFGAGTISMRF